MIKCTECFVVYPASEFRIRIRKNKSGTTNESRVTVCKDCEGFNSISRNFGLDAAQGKFKKKLQSKLNKTLSDLNKDGYSSFSEKLAEQKRYWSKK